MLPTQRVPLFRYTLNGNGATIFELSESDDGNYLRLRVGARLDFEEIASYGFSVRAIPTGSGNFSVAEVRISVVDQDEPPVFDLPPSKRMYELMVAENVSAGTVVGRIRARDPEGGAVSYSLVDDNNATSGSYFRINSQDGSLLLQDGGELDFEDSRKNHFVLKARATSGIPCSRR